MEDAVLPGPLQKPPPDLPGDAFAGIADLVFCHTGIRLGPGKSYFVIGRLADLYRDLGCRHWGEFPSRFEEAGAPSLREALVQAIVTQETRFFRDEVPFQALRERVVPQVLASSGRPAPIRVWSAGCATGQEPYSVVMALWDWVEQGVVDLEVWATDISLTALDQARGGSYDPFDLGRGIGPEAKRRFFEELPDGRARVREALRQRVRFDRVNLVDPPPRPGLFHAVFCRNVGIYFDREGKQRLYRSLGAAVRPGGYLVLGATEALLPGIPGFETVYFNRSMLFRKVPGEVP